MGGWSLNGIGPQRGPATLSRLHAKWRSSEGENREAAEIRRQWMELMGCDSSDIDEQCDNVRDYDLVEELEQLGAAIRLNEREEVK